VNEIPGVDDIREEIFRGLGGERFEATIESAEAGLIACVPEACERGRDLGLETTPLCRDGDSVSLATPLLRVRGTAMQITIAEESLIGSLSKPSGIATATRRLVDGAAGRIRIVGGAMKKMPPEIKPLVRRSVAIGGANGRMAEHPMIYLDKNYVRMLGGLDGALSAIAHLREHRKVVQLMGEEAPLFDETIRAVELGATTVFVDTGVPADVKPVIEALDALGERSRITVAFAGGVREGDLDELVRLGVDALCIGRSIVDAPLLDMRLTVKGACP